MLADNILVKNILEYNLGTDIKMTGGQAMAEQDKFKDLANIEERTKKKKLEKENNWVEEKKLIFEINVPVIEKVCKEFATATKWDFKCVQTENPRILNLTSKSGACIVMEVYNYYRQGRPDWLDEYMGPQIKIHVKYVAGLEFIGFIVLDIEIGALETRLAEMLREGFLKIVKRES